jgi:hypothetical protein
MLKPRIHIPAVGPRSAKQGFYIPAETWFCPALGSRDQYPPFASVRQNRVRGCDSSMVLTPTARDLPSFTCCSARHDDISRDRSKGTSLHHPQLAEVLWATVDASNGMDDGGWLGQDRAALATPSLIIVVHCDNLTNHSELVKSSHHPGLELRTM